VIDAGRSEPSAHLARWLVHHHRITLQDKKCQQPERHRGALRRSVYWTDSAGGLVIPGMVGEDMQRHLDIQAVFPG